MATAQIGESIEITWLPYNNAWPEKNCYIGSTGVVVESDSDGIMLILRSGATLIIGTRYKFKHLKQNEMIIRGNDGAVHFLVLLSDTEGFIHTANNSTSNWQVTHNDKDKVVAFMPPGGPAMVVGQVFTIQKHATAEKLELYIIDIEINNYGAKLTLSGGPTFFPENTGSINGVRSSKPENSDGKPTARKFDWYGWFTSGRLRGKA